jgi:DNA-binding PadR family transcriptional regulator
MTDGTARPARPAIPTLAYALLSLLAREALTGYEMGQRLRDPIGLFWQARHSQIYPVLGRLEELDWATSQVIDGRGPRPTRRYTITDVGMAALRAWLAAPQARRTSRDDLLLRVYASWVADPAITVGLLREAETRHAEQLSTYLARRAKVRAGEALDPPGTPGFADYATLRRGIGYERGRLAWVRWLIGQLEGS